jgi:sugar-specific transcriptional regulator TrmB
MENNVNGVLPEDIFTVFARLGFSKYEARAYATLSACGRLKMGQLAKYSSVPQSKIYAVADSLEEKGAVILAKDFPATAESITLKQIVSARVKRYLQDAQRVLEYVESIQNTKAFEHLYRTRRASLRINGRFDLPSQAWLRQGFNQFVLD